MNPITVGILVPHRGRGHLLAGMACCGGGRKYSAALSAPPPGAVGVDPALEGRPGTAWERTAERIGARGWLSGGLGTGALSGRSYTEPQAVLLFIGARWAAMLAGAGYFFHTVLVLRVVPAPRTLAISLILTVVGFFLPDFWLRNRIKARQREIEHTLPDVLDLLMVCVEAGMGFDAAVARVAEQPEGRHSPCREMLRMPGGEGRPAPGASRARERTRVNDIRRWSPPSSDREAWHAARRDLGSTPIPRAWATPQGRRAHLAPLKMLFPPSSS
jgi:hypothetical protein